MKKRGLFRIVLFAIFVASSALTSYAETAQISGGITDASQAVVPNARIIVANVKTGIERNTTSNQLGYYNVPFLNPGSYRISVMVDGFKTVRRDGIQLSVDQVARIDFVLEVGEVTQEVVVGATVSTVESENANIGGFVNQTLTQQLPLNGRQFLALATLLPGISVNAGSQVTGRGAGPRSFGIQLLGSRPTDNTYLIDGVDSFAFKFKNTSVRPAVGSVQEFNVLQNPYDVQYGVTSGAAVNVITRSGSNTFHGEAFEFLRNDNLDARNFFAARKPNFAQNEFGANLGGPLRKDRGFFFFAWESFRQRQALTNPAQVPTAAQLQGDFSTDIRPVLDPLTGNPFPGNIIPQSRIHPVAREFIPFFPAPNTSLSAPNFINSESLSIDENSYTVRVDQKLSDKLSVFGRYSFNSSKGYRPGAIPLFGFFNQLRAQNVTIASTYIVNPSTVVDLRVGYNRTFRYDRSGQVGARSVSEFDINGLASLPVDFDGVPSVSVLGFSAIGDSGDSPLTDTENSEQVNLTVSHVAGRHATKFGAGIWPIQLNRFVNARTARGSFGFTNAIAGGSTGLPAFLLGLPQSSARSIGVSQGFAREDARATFFSFYAGDEIRVTQRLHLSIGLRYELRQAFVDKQDRLSTFIPGSGGRIVVAGDPSNGFSGRKNRALYSSPRTDFAPRVGVAYDLTGDGKTVLRSGYGIFYNIPIFNTFYLGAINPPFVVTQSFQSQPQIGLLLDFSNPFPTQNALAGGAPGGLMFTNWYKRGYVQKWSLGIQRELTSDLGLEMNYVGIKGTSMDALRIVNQGATPGTPNAAFFRPDPNFGTFTTADSFGDSNFHSLQVKVTRQVSKALTFLAGYTYGHAIENSAGEGGGSGGQFVAQDTNNLRAERASSDFDVRQRATVGAVYLLPSFDAKKWWGKLFTGWEINGIYQVQSGFPFTAAQSGNRSGTFGGSERPQLVAGCNPRLPGGLRTRERWFDTGCFTPSPLGRFGDAGRNILTQPGLNNFDLSLVKRTLFAESRGIEFRAEFFNAFNNTQFGAPGWLGAGGIGTNVSVPATFGVVTAAKDPRQIQLALKLFF